MKRIMSARVFKAKDTIFKESADRVREELKGLVAEACEMLKAETAEIFLWVVHNYTSAEEEGPAKGDDLAKASMKGALWIIESYRGLAGE